MLQLNVDNLVSETREALLQKAADYGGRMQTSFIVPDLYEAHSKQELARNWLKVWYLAECLAEAADSACCNYWEGGFGVGHLQFELFAENPTSLVDKLIELAPAFDCNNMEATALIYDEADEWLEKRKPTPAMFPDIEKNFRDDAESASIQTDAGAVS